MGRGVRCIAAAAGVLALFAGAACAPVAPGASPSPAPPGPAALSGGSCALPAGGVEFGRVAPESVGLAADAVDRAVEYGTATGAQSVRVYRHDCLVATSGNDALVEWVPLPAWSMTKGVVSMVVGRAVTMGLLGLDDPVGPLLAARGVVGLDPAHAALTVRQFLTQTTGLRLAFASDVLEAATADSVAAVLRRPFEAAPGSTYLYAQTAVSVLVAVVEGATGRDFQAFARDELFRPVGIADGDWSWARDPVGTTQGFAFLDMAPRSFGRLGTLLLHQGRWGDRVLIAEDYVAQGARGTAANPCYGFLWWTNDGTTCHNATFPAPVVRQRRWLPPAPADAFGLSGMFDQEVTVIPSLDMVVVRMGLDHRLVGDPLGLVAGQRARFQHRLFRLLMAGVSDVEVPDVGDWVPDPDDPPVDWFHILELPLPPRP